MRILILRISSIRQHLNRFITTTIVKQPPQNLCFGYVIILWQKKCFYQESIGNSNTRHSVRTRIFAFQLSLGLSKSRDCNSFIEFSIFNAIARREPPDSHVSRVRARSDDDAKMSWPEWKVSSSIWECRKKEAAKSELSNCLPWT